MQAHHSNFTRSSSVYLPATSSTPSSIGFRIAYTHTRPYKPTRYLPVQQITYSTAPVPPRALLLDTTCDASELLVRRRNCYEGVDSLSTTPEARRTQEKTHRRFTTDFKKAKAKAKAKKKKMENMSRSFMMKRIVSGCERLSKPR